MSKVSREEQLLDIENRLGLQPGEQLFAVFSVEVKSAGIRFGLKIPKEIRDAVRDTGPVTRASILEGLTSLFEQLKRELEVSQ